LSPQHAATLLGLATADRRQDILRRVMDLDESASTALDEIHQSLRDAFARHVEDQQKSRVRMSRVRAIWSAADARLKAEIRGLLKRQGDNLVGPPDPTSQTMPPSEPDAAGTSVHFDRIVDVPDDVVGQVFRCLRADVAAVALIGASQPARKDLLQRIPKDLRQAIEAQLAQLGPVRVADIQLAQQMVLSLIERLLNRAYSPQDVPFTLSA
jgi:flagellar motor switch protein FliG